MNKKQLIVVFVSVLMFSAACNCCRAGERSLNNDEEISAFVLSLKGTTDLPESAYDSFKGVILYTRDKLGFDEATALKCLSKDVAPNDTVGRATRDGYIYIFLYLYYDNSGKLVELYDVMSDHNRDSFYSIIGLFLYRKVGEPCFEITKRYLQDLAGRWGTDKSINTSNSTVKNGLKVLLRSPSKKYIPFLKTLLQKEGMPKTYPETIVRYVYSENIPGLEDEVMSYFSNYAVRLSESRAIVHYLVTNLGTSKVSRYLSDRRSFIQQQLEAIETAEKIVNVYIRKGDTQDRTRK